MRVVFTPLARQDLREIALYIARDNRTRAVSFVDELKTRCDRLKENPLTGAEYHRILGVRRLVFGRYLIFYRVKPNAVIILRIVAGVRNLTRLGLRL